MRVGAYRLACRPRILANAATICCVRRFSPGIGVFCPAETYAPWDRSARRPDRPGPPVVLLAGRVLSDSGSFPEAAVQAPEVAGPARRPWAGSARPPAGGAPLLWCAAPESRSPGR